MTDQSMAVKQTTKEYLISQFLTNSNPSLDFRELFILMCVTQQTDTISSSSNTPDTNSKIHSDSMIKEVEIKSGKKLKISSALSDEQIEMIICVLKKYKNTFSWDYSDMKGIHPYLCTQHIYTK